MDAGEGKTAKRFLIRRNNSENVKYCTRDTDDDTVSGLVESCQARAEEFDISNGTDEMVTAVKAASEQGEVVTRFLTDPENPNVRMLILERRLDQSHANAA